MRSAAPIEGQLSFAVLTEEDPPAEAQPPRSAPAAAVEVGPPPGTTPQADVGQTDRVRADPQDWHAILDFERTWSGSPTAKQRAVRDRFGIGSARYHQLLDRALERPEALVYDPALVGRLRRLREVRRRKRFAARLDVDPPADVQGGPSAAQAPTQPHQGKAAQEEGDA